MCFNTLGALDPVSLPILIPHRHHALEQMATTRLAIQSIIVVLIASCSIKARSIIGLGLTSCIFTRFHHQSSAYLPVANLCGAFA
jgi:hypothetical protein